MAKKLKVNLTYDQAPLLPVLLIRDSPLEIYRGYIAAIFQHESKIEFKKSSLVLRKKDLSLVLSMPSVEYKIL